MCVSVFYFWFYCAAIRAINIDWLLDRESQDRIVRLQRFGMQVQSAVRQHTLQTAWTRCRYWSHIRRLSVYNLHDNTLASVCRDEPRSRPAGATRARSVLGWRRVRRLQETIRRRRRWDNWFQRRRRRRIAGWPAGPARCSNLPTTADGSRHVAMSPPGHRPVKLGVRFPRALY